MEAECSSTESQVLQEKIKIGNVILKSYLPKFIESTLDIVEIKNTLVKNNWRIKKKSYSKEWSQLWESAEECLTERIMIESENPFILRELSTCKFTNLTVLNLSHNLISSLESLTYIDASNLQFIYLETNKISNVKSISKFYYQNLEEVDLSGNKLSTANQIERLKTNKNKESFSIELFNFTKSHHHHHALEDDNSNCKIEDISILAKLEYSFCEFLQTNQKNKKYEMLKRQLEYLFLESQSDLKLTTALPQFQSLKSLSKKFYW